MPSRSELYTEDYVHDVVASILHPEFGSIYREPDGEAYLAYQAGLTDGRAESTRKKRTVSETTTSSTPAETSNFTPTPMSKTEAGVWLTVGAAVVTVIGFAIRADIKNQEKYVEEERIRREERDAKAEATRKARSKWFDDQRKGGKVVLELRDGRYVAISNEAWSQAEIKKKGEWL